MEHGKRKTWGRFWAGALCAALWSWLAGALITALLMPLHRNFDWGARGEIK